MADNVSFGLRTESQYTLTSPSTSAGMQPEVAPRYNCNYSCPRQVYVTSKTREYYETLTSEEREVIKEEYYQSYDYMVGMRTAASLGGTILIFTVFILYKMKCRHGKKQTGSKNVVPDDIEKEGGLPGFLTANKPPNPFSVNNVGSRRSSRVVLTPEDFQFLTRQDRRRLSSIATSSRSDGPRMSCGAIPPFRRGDRMPFSYSITSQLPHPIPRFIPKEELDSRCKLLTPDLTPEPIDIHIIQPTPNVSPCGSIRRLSEDVGTGCRSKEHTSVSIPLLTLPKCRQAKVKCKARRGEASGVGGASPPSILLDSGDGSSSASNANLSLRPSCSSSCGDSPPEMKFIDYSDSDVMSISSDSDVFGPIESEFVQGFLQCTTQTIEHAQINSNVRESNEESSISETQC